MGRDLELERAGVRATLEIGTHSGSAGASRTTLYLRNIGAAKLVLADPRSKERTEGDQVDVAVSAGPGAAEMRRGSDRRSGGTRDGTRPTSHIRPRTRSRRCRA